MLSSPWVAAGITLALCLLWMQLINFLTKIRFFSTTVSRKIVHIGTGPIFIICWLLFPEDTISKYLASIVPFLIVLQLVLIASGLLKDSGTIKTMARNGEKQELLRGPLLYGIVFVIVTIFFWKSTHAIIALMILCAGDGTADLIGSRLISPRLPWSKTKTLIGSISMFIFGSLLTILILLIYSTRLAGIIINLDLLILPVLFICFVATLVESITPSDWDNLTIPAVSLVSSALLLIG